MKIYIYGVHLQAFRLRLVIELYFNVRHFQCFLIFS